MAIRGAGQCAAKDSSGQKLEKLAPEIHEPVYLQKSDCFIAALPSSRIRITYGIDFPKVCFISSFYDQEMLTSKHIHLFYAVLLNPYLLLFLLLTFL